MELYIFTIQTFMDLRHWGFLKGLFHEMDLAFDVMYG